jgi:glycosyltransferase involved in cell wall biosynthesis
MKREATDVCLLLEGTYPFVQGGVSAWTHALIQAAPHLTFTVVSLLPDRKPREAKYKFPPNVRRHELVYLDSGFDGRKVRAGDHAIADAFCTHMQRVLGEGSAEDFIAASDLIRQTGTGQRVLLNSRAAWRAMERAYDALLPSAPLVEFFWTWRVLVRSMISIIAAPLPESRVYHAISTGYAGVYGARAHYETDAPLLITEHGIYTNERRIEIGLAEWLFDSGRDGFSVAGATRELRDLWQGAFSSFAKLGYDAAEVITTLYTGNQMFQLADGADRDKLRVIPNGVDYEKHARIPRDAEARRPTVGLIGRVVPIKDIRTFIFAMAALKQRVPDVRALILGPEDEDEEYSNECRQLVAQEGLEDCISFVGRVNVVEYLGRIDVIALTSVSEAQPLVLLEAGAAGVPSVATDVGSCREMLEGFANDSVTGHGGIVAPVGDYGAIANALERLLTDSALHASMSEVIRRRVEMTYNKIIVDRIYNELYDSMLVAGRCAPAAQGAAWLA